MTSADNVSFAGCQGVCLFHWSSNWDTQCPHYVTACVWAPCFSVYTRAM